MEDIILRKNMTLTVCDVEALSRACVCILVCMRGICTITCPSFGSWYYVCMYVSKDTRLLLVAEYTLALVSNQNQADRWVNGLPPTSYLYATSLSLERYIEVMWVCTYLPPGAWLGRRYDVGDVCSDVCIHDM